MNNSFYGLRQRNKKSVIKSEHGEVQIKEELKDEDYVLEKKRNFKCKICSEEFMAYSLLTLHKRNEHAREKDNWSCKICDGLVFKTRKMLKEHNKKEHPRRSAIKSLRYNYTFNELSSTFNCKTCDRDFANKEDIEEHVLEHEERYTCKECNEVFDQLYYLSIHLREHTGGDTFKCALCEYKTKGRSCLQAHVNQFHLKMVRYTCEECSKGFHDIVMYKEHLKQHESNQVYECIVCNKKYPYSRYLLTHQIRYHTVHFEGVLLPNQCSYCRKKFAKESTLLKHQQIHIPRKEPHEKTHLCDICGKGFARVDKLRLHYRVHTGEKPYKCSYCEKCFTKKDYLRMHERIHTGEKPYACEYCGKCFNQDAPLRNHIRSHTGEKPFSCTICQRSFVSRGALNIHMKGCANKEIL